MAYRYDGIPIRKLVAYGYRHTHANKSKNGVTHGLNGSEDYHNELVSVHNEQA